MASQWIELLSRPLPDVLKGFLDRFVAFCQSQEDSPGIEELFRPVLRALQVSTVLLIVAYI